MKTYLLSLIIALGCFSQALSQGTGTIQARVWNDKDGDGIQDNGENGGINGVTIQLLDLSDNVIQTAETQSNGVATFTGVPSDAEYRLKFELFDKYKFTLFKRGSDRAKDSDAKGDGRTERFSVEDGKTQSSIDAGVWSPGIVKARIWNDTDGDGIQDNGENGGLAGIKVQLLDASNNNAFLGEAYTQSNGVATISGAPADRNLRLKFDLPEFHKFTLFKRGSNRAKDSDAKGDGTSEIFSASKGSQVHEDADAGMWAPGKVTARVWNDKDGDGIQDNGENGGLGGIKVDLLDASNGNAFLGTANTGSNGVAVIDNAPADRNLRLRFHLPKDHAFTLRKKGPDRKKDSDAKGDGTSEIFSASEGSQNHQDADAGMWPPGVVNARVWFDKDGDGVQDNGENGGVYGMRVTLVEIDGQTPIKKNGKVVSALTSCGNGIATLNYVPADRPFKLLFEKFSGTSFSQKNKTTDNKDSDPKSGGDTELYQADRGSQTFNDIDAGLSVIGNRDNANVKTFVWDDRNADGNQSGEGGLGIANVKVRITDKNGRECACGKTGSDGRLTLPALGGLQYRLKFDLPKDHKFTSKSGNIKNINNSDAKSNGSTDPFTVEAGDMIDYVKAGMFTPGSLETLVFDDRNDDGNFQGEGGLGIAGVKVTLIEKTGGAPVKRPNGSVVMGTTGSDGKTTLDYVPANRDLRLKYELPKDHKFAKKSGNITNAKNSDAKSDGNTDPFKLVEGNELIKYVNAGMFTPGSVETFVFDDRNADGNFQGEGGLGIGGVEVTLIEKTGGATVKRPDNSEVKGTTGSNGKLTLDYVPADRQVRLKYTLPADHKFASKSGNIKNEKNSDAKSDGNTDPFELDEGNELIKYVNAGMFTPGSVETFVFNDKNADGSFQGEGSSGIAGVEVTLIEKTGGDPVKRPDNSEVKGTTGSNGKVTLNYVPANREVRLKYELPKDHKFTSKSGPIKNEKNSDAKTDGNTDPFKLAEGNELINYVNAGMFAPGSISTFVFVDKNGDGNFQNEGGLGVNNVTVTLIEKTGGATVKRPDNSDVTGTTGPNGKVTLDYVPANRDLRLKYVLPGGETFTSKSGPIKNAKNSDAKSDGNTDPFKLAEGSENITYVNAGIKFVPAFNTHAPNNENIIDFTAQPETVNGISEEQIVLFPSIVSNNLTIAIQSSADIKTVYRIVDALGRTHLLQPVELFEGKNQFEITVGNLPSGMYFFQVQNSDKAITKQFIIAK